MLVIGHRGCNYPGYNQNTIRAFQKVTSEGVGAIEFDVQLSADNELVVIHNLNLEEVSTGSGKVNTTSAEHLKTLYAGNPARGKDRIPFLAEVFDFFASLPEAKRPNIHLELKGDNTGKPAGELLRAYLISHRLQRKDVLVSSFNWQELLNIRMVCPELDIALLDGAIRRKVLLGKAGKEAEPFFEKIFAYGCEDYMLPRSVSPAENYEILQRECAKPHIRAILEKEITRCLGGKYYTESLLKSATNMGARSVNLWYRTVTAEFVQKAHERGLAVLVYTTNSPTEWRNLANIGIDGFFTDNYAEAAAWLEREYAA